ncbi:hypothetical protein EAI_06935 [Harpegnathos saltator]|uniref:Uncharacterized protein n=1 Tax=Harpegnathos saltator TaxID=610380 RepID=E2C5V5_HARSA|nr:hypothetical protein EAI_06935 [Harpegnathos saltator]
MMNLLEIQIGLQTKTFSERYDEESGLRGSGAEAKVPRKRLGQLIEPVHLEAFRSRVTGDRTIGLSKSSDFFSGAFAQLRLAANISPANSLNLILDSKRSQLSLDVLLEIPLSICLDDGQLRAVPPTRVGSAAAESVHEYGRGVFTAV